jgi:hypothetical protein
VGQDTVGRRWFDVTDWPLICERCGDERYVGILYAPLPLLGFGLALLVWAPDALWFAPELVVDGVTTFSLGLMLTGIPSSSDVGLADHETRVVYDLQRRHALLRHGAAEGIEQKAPEQVLDDTVAALSSATWRGET